MAIELIKDKDIWDEFVEASRYGLLFHRWDFLKIIEKHSGYKLLPYGIYEGNTLICLFPMFLRHYRGLKLLFSPPPQTAIPYLGMVLSPDYDTLKQRKKESYMNTIVEETRLELKKISPNCSIFTMSPGILDLRSFKWGGYGIESLFSYTINLERPENEILGGFGKDCRERIRKFNRVNATLTESRDLGTYYDQSKKLYGEQGLNLPLLPQRYLEEIMKKFPENITMYFLERDGEVIDIEGVYAYKDNFKLLFGASRIEEKYHGNQEYSTWELIKKAKKDGYRQFEIVGANTKRIRNYQSKFNPSLSMYFSVSRYDAVGHLGEWFYMNFVRKKLTITTALKHRGQ
jgi:hypothetical protein